MSLDKLRVRPFCSSAWRWHFQACQLAWGFCAGSVRICGLLSKGVLLKAVHILCNDVDLHAAFMWIHTTTEINKWHDITSKQGMPSEMLGLLLLMRNAQHWVSHDLWQCTSATSNRCTTGPDPGRGTEVSVEVTRG